MPTPGLNCSPLSALIATVLLSSAAELANCKSALADIRDARETVAARQRQAIAADDRQPDAAVADRSEAEVAAVGIEAETGAGAEQAGDRQEAVDVGGRPLLRPAHGQDQRGTAGHAHLARSEGAGKGAGRCHFQAPPLTSVPPE